MNRLIIVIDYLSKNLLISYANHYKPIIKKILNKLDIIMQLFVEVFSFYHFFKLNKIFKNIACSFFAGKVMTIVNGNDSR